jgi:hypothetical protein
MLPLRLALYTARPPARSGVISDNENSRLTTIGIPGFLAVGNRSKLLKRKEIGWLPISR